MTIRYGLLMGLIALAPASFAASPPNHATAADTAQAADAQALADWRKASLAKLVASDDADALFAAANLAPLVSHGDAGAAKARLKLLDRAASMEPGAADIATFALVTCAHVSGCPVDDYARRLRLAAPDDAGWLFPGLDRAVKAHDDNAITTTLQQMAAAHTLNDYWIASATRIERAYAALPLPPRPSRIPDDMTLRDVQKVQAWNIASSLLPSRGLEDIVNACKPQLAAFASRRAACYRIGAMLQQHGTVVQTWLGLRLQQRTAPTAAAAAAARTGYRRARWQLLRLAAANTDESGQTTTTAFRSLNRAIVAAGSELGGIRAELKRRGLPLDPPADWHPHGDRSGPTTPAPN